LIFRLYFVPVHYLLMICYIPVMTTCLPAKRHGDDGTC